MHTELKSDGQDVKVQQRTPRHQPRRDCAYGRHAADAPRCIEAASAPAEWSGMSGARCTSVFFTCGEATAWEHCAGTQILTDTPDIVRWHEAKSIYTYPIKPSIAF